MRARRHAAAPHGSDMQHAGVVRLALLLALLSYSYGRRLHQVGAIGGAPRLGVQGAAAANDPQLPLCRHLLHGATPQAPGPAASPDAAPANVTIVTRWALSNSEAVSCSQWDGGWQPDPGRRGELAAPGAQLSDPAAAQATQFVAQLCASQPGAQGAQLRARLGRGGAEAQLAVWASFAACPGRPADDDSLFQAAIAAINPPGNQDVEETTR